MPTRRIWHHAALLALLCAILVFGCGLGDLALRRGLIEPPNMDLELGGMHMIGIRSNSPECARLIIPGCSGLDSATDPEIYTVWLFQQSERDAWSQPRITRLLSLRMGRMH